MLLLKNVIKISAVAMLFVIAAKPALAQKEVSDNLLVRASQRLTAAGMKLAHGDCELRDVLMDITKEINSSGPSINGNVSLSNNNKWSELDFDLNIMDNIETNPQNQGKMRFTLINTKEGIFDSEAPELPRLGSMPECRRIGDRENARQKQERVEECSAMLETLKVRLLTLNEYYRQWGNLEQQHAISCLSKWTAAQIRRENSSENFVSRLKNQLK